MKVAILSSGCPTNRYPLNGVFAFDQAKALAQAGIDVYFLSIDLRSIRNRRHWGYTHGEQDSVKWYNYSLPIGPFTKILQLVAKPIILYLYKKAFDKNSRPDLCHAHFTDMGNLAFVLKKNFGTPYVVTEHSSTMNKDVIPEWLLLRAKESYSNAEKVITVSSLLAESVLRKTGEHCIVIPNIIDTSVFGLKNRNTHEGLRIVSTALLSERKRIHLLLQAVAELRDNYKDIYINIIGSGPEFDRLKKFANSHFPEGQVTFHGMLSRSEAGDVYKNSDCFVLPSALETFGVVYVEAMAAGLPVIATRCGGPEDFVDDSNGLLIDVDDLAQLKQAIIFMYNHYMDYDASRIKENVTMKFSPEVVANRIKSIYKEILN